MYAILKHGGHQYRVSAGDRLLVDRIPAEVGSTVTLEPVLLFADASGSESSSTALGDARVTATVVAHRRGRKLRVFSYKAKKRRRRTLGYRSQLTELLISDVQREEGATAAPKAARSRTRPQAAAAAAEPSEQEEEAAAPARTPPPKAPKRAPSPRKKASDGA
jgi:large subunit ribosomal protein L21